MTQSPPLFEEMLETYPADKRELARRVYDRFANGDATEFFTQLFLLLDVYANYAKHIPAAVSETHQGTLVALKKIREEIGLLAQNVESRSVGLDNRFQETNELCVETREACETAMREAAAMITDITRLIDTKVIAEKIQQSVDASVNQVVIKPLMQRTEELAQEVLPTLKKIKDANDEAARVWPGRIWKISLICGVILGLAGAGVGTLSAYLKLKSHYERMLAEQIASVEQSISQNKKVFRDLAIANVPISIARSTDANGYALPSGFCLYIDGAQAADMQDGRGRIFFASSHSEKDLSELLQAVGAASQRMSR